MKKHTAKAYVDKIIGRTPIKCTPKIYKSYHFKKFFNEYSGQDFSKYLKLFFSEEEIGKEFSRTKGEISDAVKRNFSLILDKRKLLEIYNVSFDYNRINLNNFIDIRHQFEYQFVLGDFRACQKSLDNCFDQFGWSFWYIKNQMSLFGIEGETEKLNNFFQSIKDSVGKGTLCFYFSSMAFWLSEHENSSSIYQKMIEKDVNELNSSGNEITASIIEFMYKPSIYNTPESISNAIYTFDLFPLIDQYEYVTRWAYEIISKSKNKKDITLAKNFISNLDLNDYSIERCKKASENNLVENHCQLGNELLLNYTNGNYKFVIDIFNNSIDKLLSPEIYTLIFAKSYLYSNTDFDIKDQIPLKKIVHQFIELYKLENSPSSTLNTLDDMRYRILNQKWFSSIDDNINKIIPNQNIGHEDELKIITYINNFCVNPIHTKSSDKLNSCLDYRVMKSQAKLMLNEYLDFDKKIIDDLMASDLIECDKIELIANLYKKFIGLNELIEFCSNRLLHRHFEYIHLPLWEIKKILEEQPELCSIHSMICLYYYYEYNNDNDYIINESFEDLLFDLGYERPSEYLMTLDTLNIYETFFFYKICNVDLMDFLGVFSSSLDLKMERVKILEYLIKHTHIEEDDVKQELDTVFRKAIVEVGSAQISSGKIYIDTDNIKDKLTELVSSLIIKYRNVNDSSDDKFISIEDFSNNNILDNKDIESRALASGDRNKLAYRILDDIMYNYLFDRDFGLDKNLSTEIRHGFFPNLMRSRVEDKYLITETDSKGKLKDNDYWIDYYGNLASRNVSNINKALLKFGKKFNKIISQANEKMKVSYNSSSSDKIFKYFITSVEIEHTKFIINKGVSAEELLDELIDNLDLKTEYFISDIKEYLNTEFRHSLDRIFNELDQEIRSVQSAFKFNHLLNTINEVRNSIKEDINTVTDWFNYSNQDSLMECDIKEAINVAVSIFNEIKGKLLNISVRTYGFYKIHSEHMRAFVTSIINLLDNAYKYGNNNKVFIEAISINDKFTISIKNSTSKERIRIINDNEEINKFYLMKESGNKENMLLEGNTGIIKSHYLLQCVDPNYDLNVKLINDQFIVDINYVQKHTNC
ncbi:TPA: hypothetical protein ACX6NP_000448 [Photobacterium damselae]